MLLVVLMLVFDGGIHIYPELQILLFRTEIVDSYLFALDGDMICMRSIIEVRENVCFACTEEIFPSSTR